MHQFVKVYYAVDSRSIGVALSAISFGGVVVWLINQELHFISYFPIVLMLLIALLFPLGLLILVSRYKHIIGISEKNHLVEVFYFFNKSKVIDVPIFDIAEVKLVHVWQSSVGKTKNIENNAIIVLNDNSSVQDLTIGKSNFDVLCKDLVFINNKIKIIKISDSSN